MKKDSFYFPHFTGARHDRKLKRVIKEIGVEGYAIYFMLLEVLREQLDFRYPIKDIDLLADEFNTSEQKIKVIITKYDLFQVDEKDNFFSIKLIYYLQPYLEKSNRARIAAQKRWDKVNGDANAYANALPEQSISIASAMQVKESKVKESKVKENIKFIIPTKEEIINYLQTEKNFDNKSADNFSDRFINYYESNGWKVGKNKMKNWKSSVATWILNNQNIKNFSNEKLGTSEARTNALANW